MKKILVLFVASLVLTSVSHAASYVHQLEGLFNLDQREFDPDGSAGSIDYDIFRINLNYRHQYKSRLFFVGNLDLNNGAMDSIGFSGGMEYNLITNPADKIEAGGGFLFTLYTGDISGIGFRPYGFIRSFISGGLFISGQLSYDLAFVELNDVDGDLKGLMINAGLGYAF